MSKARKNHWANTSLPGSQRGALTMFSAVMILLLLTGMVIYAVQVGVFEQRKSSNELLQKQTFHAAEVGIQRGQEFLIANVLNLTSNPVTNADSWLSDTFLSAGGTGRWAACADANLSDQSHPCFAEALDGNFDQGLTVGGTDEPDLRSLSYFYSEDGVTPTPIPIPIADGEELMNRATEAAEVFALLCLLDINRNLAQPVQGCLDKDDPRVDPVYFIATVLSRGRSGCVRDGNGDIVDCEGEALVAQRMGSYGPVPESGGPGVPLTSRSTFPPSGTAEIVANPNGGGPGVPVSAWLDGNDPACEEGDVPVDPSSGSWTTCEYHEWYGVDIMPDDYACPTATCSCAADERRLSYSDGNDDVIGSDIYVDPDFPCDLFKHTFGEERADYEDVKRQEGGQVIYDCDALGPQSSGFIWIDSSVGTCSISANTVIGSPGKPVFLVSAANLTRLNGGAQIYGVLVVTDVEGSAGELQSTGTNTVYGAVIVDGELGSYNGTFQIVYNDDLVGLAGKRGSLGKLYGGWTDIHEDWR